MRGRLRQRRATAAEISVLVEEQPGEAGAAPCERAAVRGGDDSLFGTVTSADKCENAESLKHFYHGAVQSIWQSCVSPHFVSELRL